MELGMFILGNGNATQANLHQVSGNLAILAASTSLLLRT